MSLRRSALLVLLFGLAALARGQFTETPYPVARGSFLLEIDAIDIAIDRNADYDYTAVGVGTVLVTTGLTPDLDLQLGAQLFHSQRLEYDTFTERDSGLGAVLVRTKWRFYSDDYTTMALLPYVRIPTDSSAPGTRKVEGGVILPWEAYFPGGFHLGAQAQVDLARNPQDDGYDVNWRAAAYVERALPANLGLYGEAIVWKSSGGESLAGQVGGGLTLDTRIGRWDYAIYRGVAGRASDWVGALRFRRQF